MTVWLNKLLVDDILFSLLKHGMVVLALYQRKWSKPTALHQHLISRYVSDFHTFVMRHQRVIKYNWKNIYYNCYEFPIMQSTDSKVWTTTYEQGHGCSPRSSWICTWDAVPVLILNPSIWIGVHHSPGFNKRTIDNLVSHVFYTLPSIGAGEMQTLLLHLTWEIFLHLL